MIQFREPGLLSMSSSKLQDNRSSKALQNPIEHNHQLNVDGKNLKKIIQKNDGCRSEDILQIFHDNFLLNIEFKEKQTIFNLIVERLSSNVRNFSKVIYYEDTNNLHSHYFILSKEQYREIFKKQNNYQIRPNQGQIILKWFFVTENFKKQVTNTIILDQIQIQEVNSLKLQVYLLRKRIKLMEKVESKGRNTVQVLQNPIQLVRKINQKLDQIERSQNLIKYEFQEENKIIILDRQEGMPAQNQNKEGYQLRKQLQRLKQFRIMQSLDKKYNETHNNDKLNKKIRKRKKKLNDSSIIQYQENDQNKKQSRKKRNKKANSTLKTKNNFQKPENEHNSLLQRYKQIQEQQNKRRRQELVLDQSQKSEIKCDYRRKIIGDRVKLSFLNGDYYFGEMDGKKYHGKGVYYTHSTKEYFQGQWKNGQIYGNGKRNDSTGNISTGFFVKGKRYGQGCDLFINGQKYEGQFENDARNGYGIYYFLDGCYYQGEWKDDQFHGKGRQYYTDKSYYQGEWNKDQKHGYGVLYRNNQQYRQNYDNGKLLSEVLVNENQDKI